MQFSTSMSADYITSTLHSQAQRVSDTLVRSLDFAANLDVLDRHGLWSFGNTLTWGYHNLGGTRDFLKYDVSIVRMQNLWWSLTGLVRVTGQDNALNYLPTVEQFQVGGVATVRGYPEGFRIGDRGYTGTVELQIPSLFRGERFLGHLLKQRFREDVFFDTGAVYDSYRGSGRAPGDNRYLTSAGGGFALALSKYFAGHFDWAVPLRNTKGISPVGFHFYLQSNPPLGEFMKKFIEGAYRTLADPAESSPEAATPCDSRCS
jgi:hemolysin activation/secretion protein